MSMMILRGIDGGHYEIVIIRAPWFTLYYSSLNGRGGRG